jgi:hypothetical protein
MTTTPPTVPTAPPAQPKPEAFPLLHQVPTFVRLFIFLLFAIPTISFCFVLSYRMFAVSPVTLVTSLGLSDSAQGVKVVTSASLALKFNGFAWITLIFSLMINTVGTLVSTVQIGWRKDFQIQYNDCAPIVDVRIKFWRTLLIFYLQTYSVVAIAYLVARPFARWAVKYTGGESLYWTVNGVGLTTAILLSYFLCAILPISYPFPPLLYRQLKKPEIYRPLYYKQKMEQQQNRFDNQ